MTELKKKQLG